MEQIALKASIREGKGKEQSAKSRKEGKVPGIVYHRGEDSVSISLDEKELLRILRSSEGENVLINLTIEGAKKKSRPVLVKEIQRHPVKRSVLHVDFNEISLKEKITVDVEVVTAGEAVGVKSEGGILEHVHREVKVKCLPTDIPKHIDVDITNLKLNDSIHVRDLKVDSKIEILTDGDTLLLQVKMPVEQKLEDTTPGETQEIEVIREKKEDETKAGDKKEEPKAEKKEEKK
jgi:large subunit ribosomal protein L25